MAFPIDPVAAAICLSAIAIGTITDIRTREVPDYVNYGLLILGLAYAMILTIAFGDIWFIIGSLAGLAIFFALGMVMYYTGQWGGGDSKMLMGIGAAVGINLQDYSRWLLEPPFLFNFVIYSLVIGALYGLIWSIGAAIASWKSFSHEFTSSLKKPKTVFYKKALLVIAALLFAASLIAGGLYQIVLLLLILVLLLSFYALVFIKAVENSCMLRKVKPTDLTEGDWIAKNVIVNGKVITGPKDLGIEKPQIEELIRLYKQQKVDHVIVKVGIPFVPSFFFAFIASIFYGGGWISVFMGFV